MLSNFCSKFNADFECKKVYACDVSCPLFIYIRTKELMKHRKLSFDKAYIKVIETPIPIKKERELLKDIFGIDFELLQELGS